VVVRLPVRHKVVSYRKKATLAQSPFFIPAVALTYYIAYSFLNESIDLTGKSSRERRLRLVVCFSLAVLLLGHTTAKRIGCNNFLHSIVFIENSSPSPLGEFSVPYM
jgi:hypothetical protein